MIHRLALPFLLAIQLSVVAQSGVGEQAVIETYEAPTDAFSIFCAAMFAQPMSLEAPAPREAYVLVWVVATDGNERVTPGDQTTLADIYRPKGHASPDTIGRMSSPRYFGERYATIGACQDHGAGRIQWYFERR